MTMGRHECGSPWCGSDGRDDLLAENERLRTRLATEEGIAAENARLMTLWQEREGKAVEENERLKREDAENAQLVKRMSQDLAASREQTAAVGGERDEALANGRILVAANTRHFDEAREAYARAEAAERSLEEARAELESATTRGRELIDEAEAELLIVQRERDEALGTFKILREDWRADVAALKTAERERDEALGWRETANTWERLCNEQAQRGDAAEREVTRLREQLAQYRNAERASLSSPTTPAGEVVRHEGALVGNAPSCAYGCYEGLMDENCDVHGNAPIEAPGKGEP
jgi:hypothetical protein